MCPALLPSVTTKRLKQLGPSSPSRSLRITSLAAAPERLTRFGRDVFRLQAPGRARLLNWVTPAGQLDKPRIYWDGTNPICQSALFRMSGGEVRSAHYSSSALQHNSRHRNSRWYSMVHFFGNHCLLFRLWCEILAIQIYMLLLTRSDSTVNVGISACYLHSSWGQAPVGVVSFRIFMCHWYGKVWTFTDNG